MIGIICAMALEANAIKDTIENKKTTTVSGVEFVSGIIGGKEAVVAVCGVGKVFAAICTEAMILEFHPDVIINSGVAGSLCRDIKISDIVVAESVVQHDMDTSPLGDPKGLISGINIINIPCDKVASEKLKNCCDELEIKNFSGVVATGDVFMSDNEHKQEIAGRFNAKACEMEGAAVGHVCYVNKVPFCVLRAISDNADDVAEITYETFAAQAAKNTHAVIDKFIRNF